LRCVSAVFVSECFVSTTKAIATGHIKECSIIPISSAQNQNPNLYYSKGDDMLLMLKEMIRRSGTDETGFFASAYWWCYGKHKDTYTDAFFFRTDGKIPEYVSRYVQHLEKKDVK
jgi:hypothetical protein